MTTVTSAKAQNPPGSQPDADQCEPMALSAFEAWSQRAKQAATPAAEALTEQDIVQLVRESR
ncbi:MAG: hypothetical protein KF796_14460 [Ramlibacter sp.]|nr:hypothetical protein [Ramlibacter sp.]